MTLEPVAGAEPSAHPPAPAPVPGFAHLRRLEAELETGWQCMQEAGHGYTAVRAALAEHKGAKPDAVAEEDEELAAKLRAAHEAQQTFLAHLDAYQRQVHTHFIDQVVRELGQAMQTMHAFYSKGDMRGVARRHRALQRLANRYRELEPLYGTARDHLRIAAYQRFYAGVVAFSARIRALDPTMPQSAPPGLVDRLYALRRGLGWTIRHVGAAVRLGVAAVRILVALFSIRQPARGTPLTNRVDDLFRAWGELGDRLVEVSGAEHVDGRSSVETITLYAPTHRHGATDNVAFAHLGLPDYLAFGAVDQVRGLPTFMKERAVRTNGLIPVGGERGSSVERALDALGRGISRNVLIYPEGTVSEGFRGTRPPREGFGESLVPRLREAGHRLRIVPIAYLDNARFLDLPPRSRSAEQRRLRISVAEPLESEMIDALLAAGGGGLLGGMVRLAWLERLVTDQEHLLGHDRARAIERRIDRELDGIRYWGSLASAPVADRLEVVSGAPATVREEPFRSKRVRVFRLPDTPRDERGQLVLENLRDPEASELLIGLRAPSHIYLSVGSQRFDGDIFRPLHVKRRDTIPPGIAIRFMGVPVKSLNAIRRRLEEVAGREQRTLTCAHSACKMIAQAANLKIDDHAELRPFLPSHVLPTRTIRKLIERGVRSHTGDRVEVQIYKTDDRPLEAILDEARQKELEIAWKHMKGGTWGALQALRRGFASLIARTQSGREKTNPNGGDGSQEP